MLCSPETILIIPYTFTKPARAPHSTPHSGIARARARVRRVTRDAHAFARFAFVRESIRRECSNKRDVTTLDRSGLFTSQSL